MNLTEMGKAFNEHSGANPDLLTCLHRAQLELDEACQAETDGETYMRVLEEIADIVLTLMSGCAANGLDLGVMLEQKHAINMTRKWEAHPELPGAVRRVK